MWFTITLVNACTEGLQFVALSLSQCCTMQLCLLLLRHVSLIFGECIRNNEVGLGRKSEIITVLMCSHIVDGTGVQFFLRGLCVLPLCCCLKIFFGSIKIDNPDHLTCISAPILSEPGCLLSAQFGTALLQCLGL